MSEWMLPFARINCMKVAAKGPDKGICTANVRETNRRPWKQGMRSQTGMTCPVGLVTCPRTSCGRLGSAWFMNSKDFVVRRETSSSETCKTVTRLQCCALCEDSCIAQTLGTTGPVWQMSSCPSSPKLTPSGRCVICPNSDTYMCFHPCLSTHQPCAQVMHANPQASSKAIKMYELLERLSELQRPDIQMQEQCFFLLESGLSQKEWDMMCRWLNNEFGVTDSMRLARLGILKTYKTLHKWCALQCCNALMPPSHT